MRPLTVLSILALPLTAAIAFGLPACSSSSSSPDAPPGCDDGHCAADAGPIDGSTGDANGPDTSIPAVSWVYLQQTPRYETIWRIEPTPDGGALVIVRSSTSDEANTRDYAVVRLNPDGKERWSTPFSCSDSSHFNGHADAFPGLNGEADVILYCAGPIQLEGYAPDGKGPWKVFRLRDADGKLAGAATLEANAEAVGDAWSRNGKVYTALNLKSGAIVGGTARNPGGMVAAFERGTGKLAYGVTAANWQANVMEAEPNGDVWVVGRFNGTLQLGDKSITSAAGTTDGVLVRVTDNGSVAALRALGGANTGDEVAIRVSAGDDGNVYVLGSVARGNSVGGDPLDDGTTSPAYFASYDASGNHRWSKTLRGNSVGYLHGKRQIVVLQHEAPSSTNPDSSRKWLVFDEAGTLQRERTIATGQLLGIYTEFRLSSLNGRLYAGGRIEGSATLFGTPLTATKDDAFAFSQEP